MTSIQMNEKSIPRSESAWTVCIHTWNVVVIPIMSDPIVFQKMGPTWKN